MCNERFNDDVTTAMLSDGILALFRPSLFYVFYYARGDNTFNSPAWHTELWAYERSCLQGEEGLSLFAWVNN